jgi:hypothetical protein
MSEVSLEGMSQEAISGLALLAKGLSNNSATRDQFLQLAKTANPDLNIPEVDIPFKMQGMLKEEREKREKLENQIRESEVRLQIKERREEMKAKNGLSDAQIVEVEKMMVDKGIMNHDTAAEFYISQQKSAAPTPSVGYSVNTVPKIDAKEFGGNINQHARSVAAEMISGFRSGKFSAS